VSRYFEEALGVADPSEHRHPERVSSDGKKVPQVEGRNCRKHSQFSPQILRFSQRRRKWRSLEPRSALKLSTTAGSLI
jgi:hypothetical protein